MNRPEHSELQRNATPSGADSRKPYEAPRVLIKRSVANATLLTAPGPMSSGLTASG